MRADASHPLRSLPSVSGDRWNPWETLKASAWVTLQYGILDGAEGRIEGTKAGGYVITLDQRLSQRERRCALAHELTHADRDMLWPPGTAGHYVMRGELLVDKIVAEKMVPESELRPFVKRCIDNGEMCLTRHICEEFDVTPRVADLALRLFEDRARSCGVVERERRMSA